MRTPDAGPLGMAALLLVLATAFSAATPAAATGIEDVSEILDVRVEVAASAETVRYVMSGPPADVTVRRENGSDLILEMAGARTQVHDVPSPDGLRLLRQVRLEERDGSAGASVRSTLTLSPTAQYRIEPDSTGLRVILTGFEPDVTRADGRSASDSAGAGAEPNAPDLLSQLIPPPPGAPPAPDGAPALPMATAPTGDYVVGNQDLLQISVFQLDSFDHTVRVQDDGTITLPLVGEIRAAGMTRKALERAVAARLSPRYLVNPQVTVFVKEFESKKVAVVGAVQKPGSYEMIGTRTLVEMLSLAEGVLKEKAARTIQVTRKTPDGGTEVIPVDFSALQAGDSSANILVQGGDIIHVPVDDLLLIYVNGAVRKPDMFKIKASDPVTVLQAVTLAGGVNERGSERRVQVVRQRPDGTAEVIQVNLRNIKKGKTPDIRLENGDIVVVPEAYF